MLLMKSFENKRVVIDVCVGRRGPKWPHLSLHNNGWKMYLPFLCVIFNARRQGSYQE